MPIYRAETFRILPWPPGATHALCVHLSLISLFSFLLFAFLIQIILFIQSYSPCPHRSSSNALNITDRAKRLSRYSHCLHVISTVRPFFAFLVSFCFQFWSTFALAAARLPQAYPTHQEWKQNCTNRQRRTDKQSTHKICATFIVTEREHMGKMLCVRVKQSQDLNVLMRNVHLNVLAVRPLDWWFFSLVVRPFLLCDLFAALSSACLIWFKHLWCVCEYDSGSEN